ncbi:hypothetical protein ACFX1T_009599 [Malus domestica]
MPKRARPSIITNQVIKSKSSTPKLFGSLPLLSPTSFESFIYRAPASKASFTKAPASKIHLQSFTYKASMQGIQIPPLNNCHFGPYMDSI